MTVWEGLMKENEGRKDTFSGEHKGRVDVRRCWWPPTVPKQSRGWPRGPPKCYRCLPSTPLTSSCISKS